MENPKRQKLLIQTLMKSSNVNSLDGEIETEAGNIATSFIDIDESCMKVSSLIDRLQQNEILKETIDEILIEIGEVFRHILYHLRDMKFYNYLGELK